MAPTNTVFCGLFEAFLSQLIMSVLIMVWSSVRKVSLKWTSSATTYRNECSRKKDQSDKGYDSHADSLSLGFFCNLVHLLGNNFHFLGGKLACPCVLVVYQTVKLGVVSETDIW